MTSFRLALREGSEFFAHEGRVWEALRSSYDALTRNGIPCVVGGGMAMALHGFRRYTDRIEIFTASDRCEEAQRTVAEVCTNVDVKLIARADPIQSVDIEAFQVITLPKLIELKLASGLSAEHRRLNDLGDVQRLITALKLPRELGEQLDASVRDEYYRLWTIAQTPDPHEQGS